MEFAAIEQAARLKGLTVDESMRRANAENVAEYLDRQAIKSRACGCYSFCYSEVADTYELVGNMKRRELGKAPIIHRMD